MQLTELCRCLEKSSGIATPHNDKVVALVRAKEAAFE